MKTTRLTAALEALVLTVTMAGCGTSAAERAAQGSAGSETTSVSYPLEVKSCDATITFEKAPEKVILVNELDAPILDELGLLDKVVARAGEKELGATGTELREKLDKIPTMESSDIGSGHLHITTEAILNLGAELVISYPNGVEGEQLKANGVNVYTPPSSCEGGRGGMASFEWVDEEINTVASIFDVEDNATDVLADQHQKVADLGKSTNRGTGAAVFITPGSDEIYAYGSSSMNQAIFEANGITNVYADQSKRVFTVSTEDLLNRNPDWILLLANNAPEDEVRASFSQMNGMSGLKAVSGDKVLFMPYALTDPPSTLSVTGATTLGELLTQK